MSEIVTVTECPSCHQPCDVHQGREGTGCYVPKRWATSERTACPTCGGQLPTRRLLP